eukprot:m.86667 g.86667  ORF g.86667 m.86667 type:complete len:115 (+) comp19855_c1_seq8:750-1094(+)
MSNIVSAVQACQDRRQHADHTIFSNTCRIQARQKRIVDTQSEAATTKSLCGVHPLSSQQTNSGATNICISGATESLCQLNYGIGLSLGFVNAKYRVALDFSLESFGLFLGSQLA